MMSREEQNKFNSEQANLIKFRDYAEDLRFSKKSNNEHENFKLNI